MIGQLDMIDISHHDIAWTALVNSRVTGYGRWMGDLINPSIPSIGMGPNGFQE